MLIFWDYRDNNLLPDSNEKGIGFRNFSTRIHIQFYWQSKDVCDENGCNIAVCFHSQAAFSTLNSNQLVWNCQQLPLKVCRLKVPFLTWVPEHLSIVNNKKRAKHSAPQWWDQRQYLVVKSTLKMKLQGFHAAEWKNLNFCRQATPLWENSRHR